MPSDIKQFTVETFDSPFYAKEFLLEHNWIESNGFIQLKRSDGRAEFAADLRNLFTVKIQEVRATHKERNTPVHACRVKMEFHGGKYLQTRVFPSDNEIPYRILFALLFMRDHAMQFSSDEKHSKSVTEIAPQESWDDSHYYVDDSEFQWSDKSE